MLKEVEWYNNKLGTSYKNKEGRTTVFPYTESFNGKEIKCLIPAEIYFCEGDPTEHLEDEKRRYLFDEKDPSSIIRSRLNGDRHKTLKVMSLFNCETDDAEIEQEIRKYRDEFDKEYGKYGFDTHIYGIECFLQEGLGEDCHYW